MRSIIGIRLGILTILPAIAAGTTANSPMSCAQNLLSSASSSVSPFARASSYTLLALAMPKPPAIPASAYSNLEALLALAAKGSAIEVTALSLKFLPVRVPAISGLWLV